MRRIILVLSLLGGVAIRGIALDSEANPLGRRSSETSATSSAAHHSGAEQAGPANESKGQKDATAGSDSQGHGRRVSRKLPLPIPARPKPTSHPGQIQRDREPSKAGNSTGVGQSTAVKPTVHPAKVANTHSVVIRPVTGSAVDGRQFKLGRSTAAASAIGGSANARKSTQALNGTGATRRH